MHKKGLATALLMAGSLASASEKPNIIVIMTDDWGNGDLSIYGVLDDIKTPNIDRLAREGVLFTDGYVTAPQCAPARAGLLTGRYQQRFGFDNINSGPLPLGEVTIASRLKQAGYVTGHVGKWHLEPNHGTVGWAQRHHPEIIENNRIGRLPFDLVEPYYPHNLGFDDFFFGTQSPYYINFDLDGNNVNPPKRQSVEAFRVDVKTDAALAFIDRNKNKPFFLYLAQFAPHTPLEATQKYLDRFPGEMKERRRYGLAMMNAVDEGVGRLMDKLKAEGLREKTLIFFLSDNGAPIGAHWAELMEDVLPATKKGRYWCGSRNDPFLGEKGMLSEGGIRVPFIASWPGTIPAGQRFEHPVISLDIAATANALAGLPEDAALDGANLIPYLTGERQGAPHEQLFFKFWNQAAIRSGDWKLIQAGSERHLLFNLREDKEEARNLAAEYPETAKTLRSQLKDWADQMLPAGLPDQVGNHQEVLWFEYYFDRTAKPETSAIESNGSFKDDFNRADTGVVSDGNQIGSGYVIWTQDGKPGALQIKRAGLTGGGRRGALEAILCYQGLSLDSGGFSVSADLKLARDSARTIGLAFNIQNAQKYYKAQISEGKVQVIRVQDGKQIPLFSRATDVQLDRLYRMQVSSSEPGRFQVSLTNIGSGHVVCSCTVEDQESGFPGGWAGVVFPLNHADPVVDNLEIRNTGPRG